MSKHHADATFVNVEYQATFHARYVYALSPFKISHVLSLFTVTIKTKDTEHFNFMVMLLVYILQNNHLNKSFIFFENRSEYIS
jgi:hypothetical protein